MIMKVNTGIKVTIIKSIMLEIKKKTVDFQPAILAPV